MGLNIEEVATTRIVARYRAIARFGTMGFTWVALRLTAVVSDCRAGKVELLLRYPRSRTTGLRFVRLYYVNVAGGVVSHTVGDAAKNATKTAHSPVAYNNECRVMLFCMFDQRVGR